MREPKNLFWRVPPAMTMGLLLAAGLASVRAQAAEPGLRQPQRASVELLGNQSELSAGLPRGTAVNLRANWSAQPGTLLAAELLSEKKFGETGGVAGLGLTQEFSEAWFGSATLLGGWGGPNWARKRVDASVSRKWGLRRQFVTTLGGYRALYDGSRSDTGLRVSANYYVNGFVVLEAGSSFNRSQPGGVHSRMPYLAATLGREGQQYLSLRAARGTEAWQALGAGSQLVDFHSTTVGLDWRWWVDPGWGLLLRAEHYSNPTYRRNTLGGGLFMQM